MADLIGQDETWGSIRAKLNQGNPGAMFNPLHSRKPFGATYAQTAGGNTFATVVAAEAPFSGVRLIFQNYTTSVQTIDAATAAASATINNGYDPLNTSGNSVAMQAVTFSGSASGTIPAATVTDANNIQPGLLVSDLLFLASYSRTDGGTLPLLFVRQYAAGTVTYLTVQSSTFEGVSQGRLWRTYSIGGNKTTGAFGTGTINNSASVLCGVQFMYNARGLCVMGVGDSLIQGYQSTSNQLGAGFLSCTALSTPSAPVTWFNGAYTGQKSPTYYANAKSYIDLASPDVVVFPTWTPNDALTEAAADAAFGRAMDIVQYCTSKRIVPILTTPIPYSGTNSTTDAYRLKNKTRALAARSAGVFVADFDAVISDNASPARILAQYNVDGTHVNDAGYSAEDTQALRPILAKILALRPQAA